MTDISSVSEALKLLNILVDQGKLAEGNNYDWCGDCRAWVGVSYWGSGYCDVCQGQDLYSEHWFAPLVKGAEAMLKWKKDLEKALEKEHAHREWLGGRDHQCGIDIVALANAYRYRMVDLGRWPK